MNFKTTMMLLILLLVVGSYFVLVESRSDTTYDREKRLATGGDKKGTPLFTDEDLSADSVSAIAIEKPDGAVTLTKEGSDWWQTEPVRSALNSWDATKLPQAAAALRYVEKFEPGTSDDTDPQKLQLAPEPLAVVKLNIESSGAATAAPVALRLGKKVGGHGFVMIEGDPLVYVVGSELHNHVLDASVNDWRKTAIDGVKEGQADHVRLVHDGDSFEMAKTDGDWSLVAPHSGRVDRKAVEDLLNDVDGIYVSKFIVDRPEDLSIYGLEAPDRMVVIRKPAPEAAQTRPADESDSATEDPAPQPTTHTLRIGAPVDLKKEESFATWDRDSAGRDVVFSITSGSVEKLNKTVDEMRDPRITTLDPADISQLKISAADQKERYLVRNEDRWQFEAVNNPGFGADDTETARLVTAITDAKATGYKPNFEPEGAVVATVTLGAAARPDPDVLKVYVDLGSAPPRHVIIRNNETTGYLVEAEDVSILFGPPSDLRDRLVLGIPRESVEGLTVSRPDGIAFEFERRIETPDGDEAATTRPATNSQAEIATTVPSADSSATEAWQLSGHTGFESSVLNNLLDGLMPLRAEKWLPDHPGLDSASVQIHRVTIRASDSDEVALLLDVASRRASATGVDMVFEVSGALADAIDAEFRHRTALGFSTTDIESVAVSRGSAALVVRKDEAGDFVSDGAGTIDQSTAGGLYDTLAGLRVDRYLLAGAAAIDAGVTITVTLTDGQSHVVSVAAGASEPHRITIGSRDYTVSSDVFAKLTAPLIEKQEDGE